MIVSQNFSENQDNLINKKLDLEIFRVQNPVRFCKNSWNVSSSNLQKRKENLEDFEIKTVITSQNFSENQGSFAKSNMMKQRQCFFCSLWILCQQKKNFSLLQLWSAVHPIK